MAEYACLYIDGIEFDAYPNSIGLLGTLFTASDEVQIRDEIWRSRWIPDADLSELPCGQYVVSVRQLCERLDLLGFTLTTAKQQWKEQVEKLIALAEDGVGSRLPIAAEQAVPLTQAWADFFNTYTFEQWCELMSVALYAEEPPSEVDGFTPCISLLEVCTRSKSYKAPYAKLPFYWGFPIAGADLTMGDYNPVVILRAALRYIDAEAEVRLDFSILIDWVDPIQYSASPPTAIVFTEGPTDREFLQRGLNLLYPHLSEYIRFCNFDDAGLGKGVPQLLVTVRTLVLTGVTHPTVVLFDNDAAGQDALRMIQSLSLPPGLRVLLLPYIESAKTYPALGPHGIVPTDINGSGCSIELYFGADVLQQGSGELTPIKFTSYNSAVNVWQSEIVDKRRVQQRFREKLNRLDPEPLDIRKKELSDFRIILETLFQEVGAAFSGQPRD